MGGEARRLDRFLQRHPEHPRIHQQLLGLVVFVVGRIRLESGRGHGLTWMFAGLAGGVGLGYLCKENAVLLPFYAFLVELFFSVTRRCRGRRGGGCTDFMR